MTRHHFTMALFAMILLFSMLEARHARAQAEPAAKVEPEARAKAKAEPAAAEKGPDAEAKPAAEGKPADGEADRQQAALENAREQMERGQDAYVQGRYTEAAQHFIDAFAASPFAAFLYNTAMAYEKAEDNDNAVIFYKRYLRAEPNAKDYAKVDVKIRSLLPTSDTGKTTKKKIDITEMEMKSLVSIRTNPTDARIRIIDTKGNVVSEATGPSGQTMVRGVYTVEATHPDYRTVYTKISVLPGQMYIVVVEMSQGTFLGFLKLKTDVPGAAVYIGNKADGQVGSTPWENVLPTGKHRIIVEKPGYMVEETEVDIGLGKEHALDLVLRRLPFGTVLLKTNVLAAKVYVDDKFLGAAPLKENIAPGKHMVRVESDGMKDYTTEVLVEGGRTTKVLVRMNPSPSRTSAWVSLGVSAAFFIGGGIAGGVALGLNNDLEEARNQGRLASDDSRIMEGFIWGLSADLSFGVGAIVGAMSIYYFLRDPLPPSEGRLFDPVDFEENPPAASRPGAAETPPTEKVSLSRPRWLVAPVVGRDGGGLALTVVF